MPCDDWFLFGLKAHLVLEDEHGEFEVRSPLTFRAGTGGVVALDPRMRRCSRAR